MPLLCTQALEVIEGKVAVQMAAAAAFYEPGELPVFKEPKRGYVVTSGYEYDITGLKTFKTGVLDKYEIIDATSSFKAICTLVQFYAQFASRAPLSMDALRRAGTMSLVRYGIDGALLIAMTVIPVELNNKSGTLVSLEMLATRYENDPLAQEAVKDLCKATRASQSGPRTRDNCFILIQLDNADSAGYLQVEPAATRYTRMLLMLADFFGTGNYTAQSVRQPAPACLITRSDLTLSDTSAGTCARDPGVGLSLPAPLLLFRFPCAASLARKLRRLYLAL